MNNNQNHSQSQNKTSPNKRVTMVFEECSMEQPDMVALKVFIETPGRDLDEEWAQCEDPTLAEIWATEVMSFVESYMHRQMMETDVNGYVMTTPKKKEMN